jgi:hypothetical protein
MATKKQMEYFDFDDLQDQIEKKYNCDIRDFTGRWSKKHGKKDVELDKILDKYPTINFKEWGHKQFTLMDETELAFKAEYDALQETRPYQDYWHWFIEMNEISRGNIIKVNFQEDLEYTINECGEDSWQAKIAKMFVDEFGTETISVLTDW